ncbi:MAG: hypothetical protein C0592_13595 [Marinilabiliales bacterium]|nr:MAG: hypothetical protein C0592_13595 [Marinilabiliales bacterium]
MKFLPLLLFSILLVSHNYSKATTWDEPWQDEIIKNSEYFILGNVIKNDYQKGTTIEIIKNIVGYRLPDQILISDFYLLHLCSYSDGHGPEFQFDEGEQYYFFLKVNEDGHYCISTPSSGFAYFDKEENIVYATYRHSYHQALVDPDIYEKTMTTLFHYYHNESYETQYITDLASEFLNKAPAGFEAFETDVFFGQHVAMEMLYHLKLGGFYEQLTYFLKDTSNQHNQISAARALRAYNTEECKDLLIDAIANPDYDDFVKVICIWTLSEFNPVDKKAEIEALVEDASDLDNGFGGNIMDPRVCTHFPTVKSALKQLLASLEE